MIRRIEEYCTKLLSSSGIKKLPFHNLQHTKEVVQNVKHLCEKMDINKQNTEILLVAAWFHDTGFSKTYKGHEEESKVIATHFLKQEKIDADFVNKVSECIGATKMPQCPTTKIAEILCDADIFHISTSHFFYRKLLLRREWEIFCDIKVTDLEWHKLNLEFLKEHQFRSDYGRQTLEAGKQENIYKVENILTYFNEE